MRITEITRRPDPEARDLLVTFIEDVARRHGERPLSDHLWLDLRSGDGSGFVGVRIADAERTLAYAQVSAANDSSSLEVVVDEGTGLDTTLDTALDTALDADDRLAIRDDAAATAVDAFRRDGGGALSWWVDEPADRDPSHDAALAARLGMQPDRRLHEMRRPLPAERHATVATRSFVPGVDDDAWLAVNNRAFAGHGEQGGWTRATLAQRIAEPWFDADGFLLHERDGRLAAFCWTKLHAELTPVVGEIYVIAVDPDFHGLGLGSQLTLAGLDRIAARGITVGNLYVDAANTTAVAMYERLGFTVHRTRRAFAGMIS